MKTTKVCSECLGTGKITIGIGYQGSELSERTCPSCKGRGKPERTQKR